MASVSRIPIHQTLKVGVMLAVVGGFLDAYTYLLEGKVFANAQTGNIVLLCIFLAEWQWLKAIYYLIPIFAYFIGILVTEFIHKYYRTIRPGLWRKRMLMIEIILLGVIALIAPYGISSVVNVAISFISAMQACTFKSLMGESYVTMTCTGNLRSATRHLFQYIVDKDKDAGKMSERYFAIIGSFCIGAMMGTILVEWLQYWSILCCCLILSVVLWMLTNKQKPIKSIDAENSSLQLTE